MLTELKKYLRNLKRRKFVTSAAWKHRLATDHSILRIESCLREIEEHVRKLDRIEQVYRDEQARDRKPVDKTAGRNELRPRLGR